MLHRVLKSGFSLIEVNLAILIAAGGLLSLFALFPLGLRQSVMSDADLRQATFASSFFEALEGNMKAIDDVNIWNNVNDFWKIAVRGTGIDGMKTGSGSSSGLLAANKAKSELSSSSTGELFKDTSGSGTDDLWYVYREVDKKTWEGELKSWEGDITELLLPPQMLVRVRIVENGDLPNRYVISLISSHEYAPAMYLHNSVYSQEFYFKRRP